MKKIGVVVMVLGIAVLIGAWITILKASFWVAAVDIPMMSILIFLSCIVTGAGAVMVDCPTDDRQVGWFSGFCLLLSAATLFYITGLSWYGSIFGILGAPILMSTMTVGGILCLVPPLRSHFFPAIDNVNFTVSRGACLTLMLAGALVGTYEFVQGWEDVEFTALEIVAVSNIVLALAAVTLSGWSVPAAALVLVVLECVFTGSFAIVATSFNLVFLVGVVAKIAYLCFSLQRDLRCVIEVSLPKFRKASVGGDAGVEGAAA